MLDLAVAVPTLVGSILSTIAAASIFVCYLVLPPQRHFRHTLILNLAAADFVNALNNSISGIYILNERSISPGTACTINGFVGHLSVQATDFTILFISVATMITLQRVNYKPRNSFQTKVLLTLGIWSIPLLNSLIGLGLNAFQPVSGNWCWLSAEDQVLRYAIGHAWRILIILSVIILYIYLFIHVSRHFASLREIAKLSRLPNLPHADTELYNDAMNPGNIYLSEEFDFSGEPADGYQPWGKEIPMNWKHDDSYFNFPTSSDTSSGTTDSDNNMPPLSPIKMIEQQLHPNRTADEVPTLSNSRNSSRISFLTRDPLALIRHRPPPSALRRLKPVTTANSPLQTNDLNARERYIKRLLVLNGYPIGYVLLWIPGLANRVVELSGSHSRFLTIAQASTQFVGLVNAVVYGYNERIWQLAVQWAERNFGNGSTNEKITISWPLQQ